MYDYKFNQQIAKTAVVKSLMHALVVKHLPIRTPLRLRWEIPQILRFIHQMGDNEILSDIQLTRKCIVLVIATTAARFSEIAQFSPNESDPRELDSEWSFTVRVKNKEFKQPITIHQRQHSEIDPVPAMKELRTRIRKRKRKGMKKDNTFWYTE
jgi:hypothetical protein